MVQATVVGFPRLGPFREAKTAIEKYWSGKGSVGDVQATYQKLREDKVQKLTKLGLDQIPVGDHALYDQVLDNIFLFGAVPTKYSKLQSEYESSPTFDNYLKLYSAMGRGYQKEGHDLTSMEMKKWFDTNYHFIVPEITQDTKFKLTPVEGDLKPVGELKDAQKQSDKEIVVTLVGPFSFLALAKPGKEASKDFKPLKKLDELVEAYVELFKQLEAAGAKTVQLEEPYLVYDFKDSSYGQAFVSAYKQLLSSTKLAVKIATYYEGIDDKLDILSQVDFDTLHIDLSRAPQQLDSVLKILKKNQKISLGLIDGRMLWKSDLAQKIDIIKKVVSALGSSDRVIISSSSSLLHVPYSLEPEEAINPQVKNWLAFAYEKVGELGILKTAINEGPQAVEKELALNKAAIEDRRKSPLTTNPKVRQRIAEIKDSDYSRDSPFDVRSKQQESSLGLPTYPTTTIGSFPQTAEVRSWRAKFRKGEVSPEQYEKFIKEETERCIRFQEKVGLDVLVHGEFERNDMVEFFGEEMEGYLFTKFGWVQSYGSRGVKPPVIYGDVSRPKAMTVEMIKYAQGLSNKPVKGMLTGPVTMLCWSFVRDDISKKDQTTQLALAIRDEVRDLAQAGINVIQVDEPAIREGLPLKKKYQAEYLDWAVKCFRLSTCGITDKTQIHTHMCYSDFQDIFDSIKAMDADVISIENSKSDAKLLAAFEKGGYNNWIGPGLYDIHSPRIPSVAEMVSRVHDIEQYISKKLIWINPDCGLKTRTWTEVEQSL